MASLQQALIVLVGIGAVYPCQAEDRVAEVKPKCIALNRYLTDQALIGHVIETLASPVTGGGIGVARFPQMFLRAQALGKHQPAEWAQMTREKMKALGQRIVKEGKPLQTEQEHLDELNAQAKEFGSKYLPILKALQIA